VRERITALRAVVPHLVMSADVMVGFPTETQQQYQDTQDLVCELDIAFPHVFSYSEREGTPAARIPNVKQVPVAQRKARNLSLRESAKPLQTRLLNSKVGQVAWVLPEKHAKREGYSLCRAEDYLAVLVPSEIIELGKWSKVRYDSVDGEYLIGVEFSAL